jgi:ubiquinone/menaquinone biosynthesis C-methylase UbiE
LKPETIENRWDILYKEYPEVYDEFASVPYKPDWVAFLGRILKIDWSGKTVVDVGSGSGLSTFDLAPHVKSVIGVEPNDAMRELAVKNAGKRKVKNVRFVKGWAKRIPLKADSADVVVAFTASLDYEESARIVREGGFIISIDVAPKWYGGELAPIILGKKRVPEGQPSADDRVHRKYSELNFKYKDFFQTQEYGSLQKIISTYGFIFGKKAIDYLKKHNKTSIKWKWRIHYKKV